MEEIFAIESLDDLEAYLKTKPTKRLQAQLAKAFLQYCCYKNAEEWNKAVRLCEALTIVGWGELEPVEAARGQQFNGNPQTAFFNRYSERRFVNGNWSKRKTGLTMQQGDTSYFYSPALPKKPTLLSNYPVTECIQDVRLASQRNWIPKNPIFIRRTISNCYKQSKALVAAVETALTPALDKEMQPEKYGTAIDRIILNYHLSFSDPGVKENYIILDEDAKISSQQLHKRLLTMYAAKDIQANSYYLRKRYDFGNFRQATGLMKVDIHFSREFSEQSLKAQRREFAEHLTTAVDGVVSRLSAKRLAYDFEKMTHDFQAIIKKWVSS